MNRHMANRQRDPDLFPDPEAAYRMQKAWRAQPLTEFDGQRPTPSLLVRDDKEALLYRHLWNVLYGLPESAKSWIAAYVILEALNTAEDSDRVVAVIIDYDDSGFGWHERLRLMGATTEQLARVRYVRPDEPFDDHFLPDDVADAIHQADVVILDPVNEAMTANYLDITSVAAGPALRKLMLEPIADRVAKGIGLGVLIAIDHSTLSDDLGRNAQFGGTTRLSGVRGVLIHCQVATQPAPGKEGAVNLFVKKDTNGKVRQQCVPVKGHPRVQYAGLMSFAPMGPDGDTRLTLYAPRVEEYGGGQAGHGVPDERTKQIIEVIDANPDVSQSQLLKLLNSATGMSDKTHRENLDSLVAGNVLAVEDTGTKKVYTVLDNSGMGVWE